MPRKPPISNAALVLLVGFLILFVGGGARFAVGLTLKPIVDELGWNRSDLGLAVATFQTISAGAMFAAGLLTDRGNPRVVLGGGLLVSGIGIGLMSVMTLPWHALALYGVVFALSNGAASLIPVGVMVTRAFPERTGMTNAVVSSGMSLGQLVIIAALAAVLAAIGWRSVFVWLGLAHLALVPFLVVATPSRHASASRTARPTDLGIAAAMRTRRFWLLIGIYAICGFNDFFVSTHVVALAQDHGVGAYVAGNLLALMGLTGLIGVLAAGAWSDRAGPVWPAAACFAVRVAAFALVMVDPSPLSVAVFALAFGLTFLITAPLAVVFVAQGFGTRSLGALTGLITMVHHICGGIGAYLGAAVFDATRSYDIAFLIMLAVSLLALLLTFLLRRPRTPAFV